MQPNEFGQIDLHPHTPHHGILRSRISDVLQTHAPAVGPRAVAFPVRTAQGVKVPDVIWMSAERFEEVPADVEASPVLPEIVVEVLSSRDTEADVEATRALYLREGAKEVWTCTEDGTVTFYRDDGPIEYSALAPSFPEEIDY